MSIKSWDFVDPKLAKKISELEKQIGELKNQRIQITENNRITKAAKQNLLKYNQQCMKDILQIYNKTKEQVVQYLDKQVTVLTKQEIYDTSLSVKQNRGDHNNSVSNINGESRQNEQKNNKSNELTKITFSEDHSCNQNYSISSNNFNKAKYDLSKQEQIQLSSNQFEKTTKISNGSTGRFTHSISISRSIQRARSRSKSRGKIKQIKSFELTNTARDFTYHENQSRSQTKIDSKKQKGKRGKVPSASISHALRKRLKRKLASKQYKIQMERIMNIQKEQKVRRMEREIQESNQLIELLYKKITILQKQCQNSKEQPRENGEYRKDTERKRKKNHKQQCLKGKEQNEQKEIANQLQRVREKYIQIEQLENKNKQLSLKRKQILKLIQQSTLKQILI